MKNLKKRTFAIATIGMMTAACSSATAGNYAENKVTEPVKETTQTRSEEKRIIIIKSHEIAEEAMEAVHEALAEAHATILEIEIDGDKIKLDVEKTVRLALLEAKAGLKEMEIEFKEFDKEKFKHNMKHMHLSLEKAVKEKHLTKQEMERIMAHVEKGRDTALREIHEALEEIRESLKELRAENKRRKAG